MKKLALLIFIATVLFTSASYAKTNNTMSLTTNAGKIIDITMTEDGLKFKQFEGKTVLLDFFGPMCPPCIIEMPHLVELQKEHKDKLQIVSVQVQMPMKKEELTSFIKKNNLNYPVINLNDAWDIVSFIKANTNWGGQIPFMLMFDKDGNMKTTYLGVVSNDKIISDINK
jgi:thiol-disulfide isomerase/thioredoxin